MSETWFWVRDAASEPSWNMARDEAFLINTDAFSNPVLRFYSWSKPAASFGYFQHYNQIAEWTPLRPLVRRPTAGGLVPHDFDWTYSLTFPKQHAWYNLRAELSYEKVHRWIQTAFNSLEIQTDVSDCCRKSAPGQCFAGPEKFDLIREGEKIAGAAQRRTKDGLLIQGSIQRQPAGLERRRWEEGMMRSAEQQWEIAWEQWKPSLEFEQLEQKLYTEKYSRDSFHQRR